MTSSTTTSLDDLIEALKMAEGFLSSIAELNPIVDHIRKVLAGADESGVTISVNLNIFDDTGVVVDNATSDLTTAQISDIVDHAAQIALFAMDPETKSELSLIARINPAFADIAQTIDEMTDALIAANVVAASDDSVAIAA
jgi:hypothetical protein